MKVLIDSIYINNSGGKTLLDYLVQELEKTDIDVYYLIDSRCKKDFGFLNKEKVSFLDASIQERHFFYKRYGKNFSKILCFANIPPTIRLPGKVYCYFHNVLLLEQPKNYPVKDKAFLKLKGYFLSLIKNKADYYLVQSENVKHILLKHLKISEKKCLVLPFYNEAKAVRSKNRKEGFIYVSNANPHKNHINLLKAWEILKNRGTLIPLHLTVTDAFPKTIKLIKEYQAKGLEIVNHGLADVSEIYSICNYAVYPSLAESFGLGLIEAVDSGIEVIASDLPYVNSIIEPLGKFDPHFPISIANAVEKALSRPNDSGLISKSKISNQIDELIALLQ